MYNVFNIGCWGWITCFLVLKCSNNVFNIACGSGDMFPSTCQILCQWSL